VIECAGSAGFLTGAAARVGGPEQVQSAPRQHGKEEGGRSRAGSASGFGLGVGLGAARRGSGHSLEARTGDSAAVYPLADVSAYAIPPAPKLRRVARAGRIHRAECDFMSRNIGRFAVSGNTGWQRADRGGKSPRQRGHGRRAAARQTNAAGRLVAF